MKLFSILITLFFSLSAFGALTAAQDTAGDNGDTALQAEVVKNDGVNCPCDDKSNLNVSLLDNTSAGKGSVVDTTKQDGVQ